MTRFSVQHVYISKYMLVYYYYCCFCCSNKSYVTMARTSSSEMTAGLAARMKNKELQ